MAIDTETYYRTYGPMVLRRCQQMLKDPDTALDAMHDVFVRVLQQQDRLRDDAPASLMWRIATNVCLNRIRARGRRPETPETDLLHQIAHTADAGERAEARSVLGRLFGREQESTQTIAVLYLHDGMTLDEVAREVGLSVSGVRKRLRALRQHLAELEAL